MNCPTCPSSVLVISDRSGIEIDYCPRGRGVWLDRGELDKIIERSMAVAAPQPMGASSSPFGGGFRRDDDDDDDDDRRRSYDHGDQRYTQHRKPKKKGFLGDLFDF